VEEGTSMYKGLGEKKNSENLVSTAAKRRRLKVYCFGEPSLLKKKKKRSGDFWAGPEAPSANY